MSVWVGSPKGRYTEEFRRLIYEINPTYLPCVYKEMFETNATNTLRDLEGNEEDSEDQDIIIHGRKNGNVTNLRSNDKYTCTPRTRCSSAVSYDTTEYRTHKQNDVSGWEICTQAHSATSVHCITTTDDSNRQRSRSASANINTARSDIGPKSSTLKNDTFSKLPQSTHKKGKQRQNEAVPFSRQTAVIKGKVKNLLDRRPGIDIETGKDFNGKSSEQQKTFGSSYNIAGYICSTTSPIKYPFVHFEYSDNYIELYRQEYTLRKIEENAAKIPKTCICGRNSNKTVPTIPIMPVFYQTDSYVNDNGKLRVTNSFHTDPKAIKTRREATMKKMTAKTTQEVDQIQGKMKDGKSPHGVLSNNAVIKMDFYTNPLTISKTRPLVKCTTPNIGCCVPTIPHKTYHANTNNHPNPTSSPAGPHI